jgi:WD40 repeat protein
VSREQSDEKPSKLGPSDNLSGVSPPRITDHELLRCIGRGSYGEVWLARNVMGTYRAVKVVYRQTFSDAKPYEREFHGMEKFEPVSRSHDGLVDILQVGRNDADGYYYYVMELGDDQFSGQTINPETYEPKTLGREVVEKGRLSFDECLQIGLSLSAALSHLHRHELIHRDIKPSNIIFVNGIPKVADIGLVASVGASKSFVGTEGFIPPEGPGTVQADIYSLGKVLYEISTGHDRQIFPELPTQLEEIGQQTEFLELNEVVLKACESDLKRRYRTAEEMHADLLLLQAGKSVKRLRMLEKRLALYARIGVVTAVILVSAAGVSYEVNREIKIAAERRQQQVGRNVAHGTRLMEEGDFFGSLPPFVEALSLDQADRLRRETHRVRIAAVLRQCPRIVQMWFLDSPLNSAELSRDGQQVIAAGVDGVATLCGLTSNSKSVPWIVHTNELEDASFSGDGRFVVTASANLAQVWERGASKSVFTMTHPGTVYSARFSPDRSQIVTASGGETEGYVWLWDAVTGKRLAEIAHANGAYRCASFSPDGKRLVTAGEEKTAQVWDLATKRPIGQPIRHTEWVYHAAFSPDGRRVVTASFDGKAQVCDAETGRPILPPLKHPAGVKSAEFSPDGRYVITAGWDFTARIWNATTGEAVHPTLKHRGRYVVHASFSPDGRRVLTAEANGVICLWDLTPVGWTPAAGRSFFSPGGERFAVVQGKSVKVRAAGNNALLSGIEAGLPVKDVKLNRDGSRLVTLSAETLTSGITHTVAQLWDSVTGQVLSRPFALGNNITNTFLSADGLRLVALTETNAMIWDTSEGKPFLPLAHHNEVMGGSFSPDGRLLATRSGTNAHVWDAVHGNELFVLSHADSVSHVEFSPNGLLLVSCSTSDQTLREREAQVWDVRTGHRVGAPMRHSDGVQHASFSPDSKRVVTASEDSTARVWDANTGRLLLPPFPHAAAVTEARFSADGRWIVTACEMDQSARVWDSETGEPVTPPLKHAWQFRHVQFVASGRGIVARRSNGESAFWELLHDEHPMEDLAHIAQLVSGYQGDYAGDALPQTREAVRDAWQKLRVQYPDDFSVSQNEIVAWHRREAEASENAGQWRAAVFNWEQLVLTRPDDPVFLERRASAKKKLDAETGAQ